jgi:hypothetical protein
MNRFRNTEISTIEQKAYNKYNANKEGRENKEATKLSSKTNLLWPPPVFWRVGYL